MIKQFSAIVLVLLWSVPAFAANPLITDDTGTQGKGKIQLELNVVRSGDRENEAGISKKETGGTIAAALTCGIVDNVDLIIGFPWQWSTLSEARRMISNDRGISDTSVDVKWRFFESKQQSLSLALKPGVTIPTGDATKGLGNGRISGGVMLIATKAWENGALHCNVGYRRNAYSQEQDNASLKQDNWHTSFASEIKIAEKIRTVVDCGIESNSEKVPDTNPVYILGGLIYSVTENFDLDVGLKAGMNHAERERAVLAGLSARL